MAVAARVRLNQRRQYGIGDVEVTLNPVITNDPDDPNHSYSKYTPGGEIRLLITNPDASDFFEFGKTYDVLFTETEG